METAKTKKVFETCITPEFRVSYPSVFTAQIPMGKTDEKEAKFSITMLFPPGADLTAMKTLARNAAVAKWGPDQTKWPKMAHPIFRSGSEPAKKDVPGYGPGVIFCQAKSSAYNRKTGAKMMPPGLVGPDRQIIVDPSEFYGGCYARAKISAYTYNTSGNVGIAFGLISVQKTRDGEPFGRKNSPETDFDAIATPDITGSKAEDAGTGNPDNGLGL